MNDMKQCPNGHFYNSDKTPVCPYCNPATTSQNRTIECNEHTAGATVGLGAASFSVGETPSSVDPTMPVFHNSGFPNDGYGPTAPVNPFPVEGVTEPVIRKKKGIDPVVGWLVCIEGPSRGQDYRIYSGNNRIGRSASMDIPIVGDDTVSQKEMAFVAYDNEAKRFLVIAGTGKNLVYINRELLPVSQSHTLSPYDRIKLGETELLFIPLCGERFDWQ